MSPFIQCVIEMKCSNVDQPKMKAISPYEFRFDPCNWKQNTKHDIETRMLLNTTSLCFDRKSKKKQTNKNSIILQSKTIETNQKKTSNKKNLKPKWKWHKKLNSSYNQRSTSNQLHQAPRCVLNRFFLIFFF